MLEDKGRYDHLFIYPGRNIYKNKTCYFDVHIEGKCHITEQTSYSTITWIFLPVQYVISRFVVGHAIFVAGVGYFLSYKFLVHLKCATLRILSCPISGVARE